MVKTRFSVNLTITILLLLQLFHPKWLQPHLKKTFQIYQKKMKSNLEVAVVVQKVQTENIGPAAMEGTKRKAPKSQMVIRAILPRMVNRIRVVTRNQIVPAKATKSLAVIQANIPIPPKSLGAVRANLQRSHMKVRKNRMVFQALPPESHMVIRKSRMKAP